MQHKHVAMEIKVAEKSIQKFLLFEKVHSNGNYSWQISDLFSSRFSVQDILDFFSIIEIKY